MKRLSRNVKDAAERYNSKRKLNSKDLGDIPGDVEKEGKQKRNPIRERRRQRMKDRRQRRRAVKKFQPPNESGKVGEGGGDNKGQQQQQQKTGRRLQTRPDDNLSFKSAKNMRMDRAAGRRNKMVLAKKLCCQYSVESDLVQRYLGVDDEGCCLRHPNRKVCQGNNSKRQHHRFESIDVCPSCKADRQRGKRTSTTQMVNASGAVTTKSKSGNQWEEENDLDDVIDPNDERFR